MSERWRGLADARALGARLTTRASRTADQNKDSQTHSISELAAAASWARPVSATMQLDRRMLDLDFAGCASWLRRAMASARVSGWWEG